MLLSILKSLFGGDDAEPLDKLDDVELMRRYADGDDRAFAVLFDRHRQGVYNFILRSCGRRAVADELVQEVFESVIEAADSWKPNAKFTTWLYTIARNACIDAARRRSKADVHSLQNSVGDDDDDRTHQELLVDDHARSGEVDVDRGAFRDRLQQALERLPDKQREAFVLREISGLKFREIADVVDAKVPTVKSRLRYALQTLRGELAEFREHRFDDDEKMAVGAK